MDRIKEEAVFADLDEMVKTVQESGKSAIGIILMKQEVENLIAERDALAAEVAALRDKIHELRYNVNCAGCPDEKRCHKEATECERMWDEDE